MLEQSEWLYERGEGRFKHCWDRDEASFSPSGRGMVGKCHSSITNDVAQRLLRNGVVYTAPGAIEPTHVYAVYRGAIYEAAPTQVGISFHGYPWRAGQGRPALPRKIVKALEQKALEDGCLKEFKKWWKEYS